jgi:hydrogenase nickel incorporation protein HypA/HybF
VPPINKRENRMHELPITRSILDWACLYAEKAQARKVVTIVLRLGALRDLQKEWVQRYFGYISRGTIAEGAEILVMVNPIVCGCRGCGREFEVDKDRSADEEIRCPACSAKDYSLISGTEFRIEGIEVV